MYEAKNTTAGHNRYLYTLACKLFRRGPHRSLNSNTDVEGIVNNLESNIHVKEKKHTKVSCVEITWLKFRKKFRA